MTRLLLDLNVVLDVLLDRPPHAAAASEIWAAVEREEIEAVIPAHAISTVFYFASRHRDAAFARRVVSDLLTVFAIAPVDDTVLRRPLALPWRDFEYAVCAASAEAGACDVIVTRDPTGFPDSPVAVVDPVTLLALLEKGGDPDRIGEAASPRPSYGSTRRRRRVVT